MAGERRGAVVELEEQLFREKWRLKRCGKWVGGGGATTALTTTTKKQQSTNEWRQRGRRMTAGKRRGAVVEAEEQLLYGSGDETAPWRMERR